MWKLQFTKMRLVMSPGERWRYSNAGEDPATVDWSEGSARSARTKPQVISSAR